MPKAIAFALPVSLVVPLCAQAVHLVGPGGYPQIQAAIVAASVGDLVLVQPGVYEVFWLTKGLTIRATGPGAEASLPAPSSFPANFVAPPAGETAHIVGMKLASTIVSGVSMLEECVIDAPRTSLDINGTTVVLRGCSITPAIPPGPVFLMSWPLKCTNADVTMIDSSVHGPLVPTPSGVAMEAIRLVGSTFRGSGLSVVTGPGQGAAVNGDAASSVWLSDSTVTAGASSCVPPYVATIVAGNGRYDRCTLTPSCSTLPQGFVLGIRAPQPLQTGTAFTLEFRAQPGSMVGVFAAFTIARAALPGFDQTLLLSLADVFPVENLIADPTGLATGTWAIPANPVFVDLPLWFQGFAGPASPFQASAVAGGLVR
jgi:hypothetical protein